MQEHDSNPKDNFVMSAKRTGGEEREDAYDYSTARDGGSKKSMKPVVIAGAGVLVAVIIALMFMSGAPKSAEKDQIKSIESRLKGIEEKLAKMEWIDTGLARLDRKEKEIASISERMVQLEAVLNKKVDHGPFPAEFYRVLHGRIHYEFRAPARPASAVHAKRCIHSTQPAWCAEERNAAEKLFVIMDNNFETIAEAFSRTAEKYDAFAGDHPNQARMRNKVYAHLERYVPAGAHVLELNAGTGTDAFELARRGYTVHATDIAPGMLERLQDKVLKLGLGGKVTFQKLSFTELEKVPRKPFDAVFSDLGGLNCIPNLSPVIAQLPKVLRPGGEVTWVLMPPVCLWEMAEIFRGHPKLISLRPLFKRIQQ